MRLLILKNILLAIDPDEDESPAVAAAVALASGAGAAIHVVAVSSRAPDEVKSEVTALVSVTGAEHVHPDVHVLPADPPLAIAVLADRLLADVVVLGRHSKGGSAPRKLSGTAMAVVTNASCPCLIVAETLELPVYEVLVPVDGSDAARGALLLALSWASALRANRRAHGITRDVMLTALHVSRATTAADLRVMPANLEHEIAHVRSVAGSWAGVSVRAKNILDDDPARGIASFIAEHEPDLVVMGTKGMGQGAAGPLGSVAAMTASRIDVSILLVPPAVWSASATPRSDS